MKSPLLKFELKAVNKFTGTEIIREINIRNHSRKTIKERVQKEYSTYNIIYLRPLIK